MKSPEELEKELHEKEEIIFKEESDNYLPYFNYETKMRELHLETIKAVQSDAIQSEREALIETLEKSAFKGFTVRSLIDLIRSRNEKDNPRPAR